MLQEEKRKQLDAIVQRMVANKETDENIQAVVADFKQKYAQTTQTESKNKLPLIDRAINTGAKVTDTIFGGGKIGETIGTLGGYAYTKGKDILKGTNVAESYDISQPSASQFVGSGLQSASLFFPGGRAAKIGTQAARYLGMRGASKAIGAIGSGALGGYGFDVATNLQQEKEGADILTPGIGTAIGGGIPAVGAAASGAKKAAQWAAPKLLSYTTDIPEQAFDTLIERREPVMKALKEGATADETLAQTRGAVRQLRKTLSQEWDDSVKSIADEFKTQRVGVAGDLEKKLETLADQFEIKLPQNTKSASVVEWMDTLKSINELPKLMLSVSPKGVVAREAKKELKDLIVKEFGGTNGSVATLYQNYSAKKTVFDAANQIVQAYSNGKPIQQSTAIGRLKALFNDNKSAYLDAILQLEKETGTDLLSRITALQFAQKLPRTGTVLSASGGLKSSKGPLDKALDLLLIPLTSPRSAAWITSSLNKASKAIPDNMSVKLPGDVLFDKVDDALKDIPNKQGGFVAVPNLGGSADDLVNQAKKYNTLEEFVKKNLFFRGEGGTNPAAGKAQLAKGKHFALGDEKYAKTFGETKSYVAKPGAKIFDAGGMDYPEIQKALGLPVGGKFAYISPEKFTEELKKSGYDILRYDGTLRSDGRPFVHVVEITPNSFIEQTRSQLTSIWNKAHESQKEINPVLYQELLAKKDEILNNLHLSESQKKKAIDALDEVLGLMK